MNQLKKLLPLFAATLMLGQSLRGDETTNSTAAEIQSVVSQINQKLKQHSGKVTEEDLADDLKAFDKLEERAKSANPADAVRVLRMKASLYLQVLDQPDKALAALKEAKAIAGKDEAAELDAALSAVERMMETKKVRESLKTGAPFPDFQEKDLDGKPLSVSIFKGKVLLIDFWATWCGPCVAELPNVLKTYEQYHEKGFEILGVSLDQDRDRLASFIEQRKIPWQQFFDGQGWQNKLAAKYGVDSIPATYLLDQEGRIIASGLRGEELGTAVAKALEKK